MSIFTKNRPQPGLPQAPRQRSPGFWRLDVLKAPVTTPSAAVTWDVEPIIGHAFRIKHVSATVSDSNAVSQQVVAGIIVGADNSVVLRSGVGIGAAEVAYCNFSVGWGVDPNGPLAGAARAALGGLPDIWWQRKVQVFLSETNIGGAGYQIGAAFVVVEWRPEHSID